MSEPDIVSDNITMAEATKSNTAIRYDIDNNPGCEERLAMQYVATQIFEKVRAHFGVPIAVTSFFRSLKLNKKVGGSKTSQHVKGEAMDMDADVLGKLSNRDIFYYIKNHLDFDQLIWEYGDESNPAWVHVSLKRKEINAKEILVAYKYETSPGKFVTRYKPYRS